MKGHEIMKIYMYSPDLDENFNIEENIFNIKHITSDFHTIKLEVNDILMFEAHQIINSVFGLKYLSLPKAFFCYQLSNNQLKKLKRKIYENL